MFIVKPNPTFTHPVIAKVPVDGGYDDQRFTATFQVMPVEEAAEYDLTDGKSSAAFLRRVIVELGELADAGDKSVPYNDALRDQLLNVPYVRTALAKAYLGAIGGAALGN